MREYEEEASNILDMNVVHFTPIIKNSHGHNFKGYRCIVTQIGNLPPAIPKFLNVKSKLTNIKKNTHALL